MLLEKLLAHLDLEVEPFALCEIGSGWRLNLRGPDAVVLHFVLQGRGALRCSVREPTPLEPDVLVVVPPGLDHWIEGETSARRSLDADASTIPPHSGIHRIVAGDEDGELIVACGRVRPTYGGSTGIFDHLSEPLAVGFADRPAVRSLFASLIEEQAGQWPGGVRLVTVLMEQCFVHLLRKLCDGGECGLPWLDALVDERLGKALDAILERPESAHTVESLAAIAGMSRSSFAERFAKAFRRSPIDVVRDVRLRRAARLLRTSELSLPAVARRVGFSSRSQFSRAFAAQFGVPPAEYRAST